MVNTPMTIMMIIIILAMIAMMVIYASSYKTVPPNRVLVLYRGNRKKGAEPQGMISGGGKFIIPGMESYYLLDLTADLLEFELHKVTTRSEGNPVTMRLNVAVIWKITSESRALKAAAGTLVDGTRGENRMDVKEQVEKAIRNAANSITAQEFEKDRDLLSDKFVNAMGGNLSEKGLEIRSLVFLKIKPQG